MTHVDSDLELLRLVFNSSLEPSWPIWERRKMERLDLKVKTICDNDKKTRIKTITNAKTKKERSNIERECAGLKKWSSSQTREFGDLHALIATLVLACDTRWVPSD